MGKSEESPPRNWSNWAYEQHCSPAEIVTPRTREGLVHAIVTAREEGRKVRVAGSGHSFTPVALTDGTMLRIEPLDRILEVDRTNGLVKVEAGAILGDLNERLDEHGLAFANLGDIDHQTLAGSISTGTHGTGIGFQNVSAQVEALELIDAEGRTRTIDGSDPKKLQAARVSLGTLGVIYAATLKLVHGYTLNRFDHKQPLAPTLDEMLDKAKALDHFEFYVFPHTDVAICRESTRTHDEPQPQHPAEHFAREIVLENWLSGAFVTLNRVFPKFGPTLARLAASNFSNVSKVDKSYRVFASERRIRFTEMEYSVPVARAREAVDAVLEIANDPALKVVFPIEVRFVKGDDALLSPSHERDSCYIAVHQDRSLNWSEYFGRVEKVLSGMEGRPHWGKRHTLGVEQLSSRYPRFGDFQSVRKDLDPSGAFGNDYIDSLFGPASGP